MVIERHVALLGGIALVFCGSATLAQQTEAPIRTLSKIAVAHKLPIGIVLGEDRSLCTPRIVRKLPADSRAAILEVLAGTSYTAQGDDVLVVSTTKGQSEPLYDALMFKYPRFPMLNGTFNYMGAVLNGWLINHLDPRQGFMIHSASASTAKDFQLQSSSNVSTIMIANSIVQMDGKGLWVASQDPGSDDRLLERIRLDLYSYDENRRDIEGLRCVEARKKE